MHSMREVFGCVGVSLGVTDVDMIIKVVTGDESRSLEPAQEIINDLDMMELRAFAGQDHQSHITAHLIFGASPLVGQMPQVAVALQKHILEHVTIQAGEPGMKPMQPARDGDEAQMVMQYQAVVAPLDEMGMQQAKEFSGKFSG